MKIKYSKAKRPETPLTNTQLRLLEEARAEMLDVLGYDYSCEHFFGDSSHVMLIGVDKIKELKDHINDLENTISEMRDGL